LLNFDIVFVEWYVDRAFHLSKGIRIVTEVNGRAADISAAAEDRRRFLRRAAKIAATAPAAALLLSASAKQAMATNAYNNGRFGTTSPGNSAGRENGIGGSDGGQKKK
jgi:hypothetical protein